MKGTLFSCTSLFSLVALLVCPSILWLHGRGGDGESAAVWLPPAPVGTAPPLDPLSCKPQLVFVGTPKGGSTAVFSYLNGTDRGTTAKWHPAFAGGFKKEMHLFNPIVVVAGASTTEDKLRRGFPGVDPTVDDPLAGRCSLPQRLGLKPGDPPALVRFEVTPNYLSDSVAHHLKRYLPEARYVMMLREPVSRAISHVNMLAQDRHPNASYGMHRQYIVDQLEREAEAVLACQEAQDHHSPSWSQQVALCMANKKKTTGNQLFRGLYDIHLARWFQMFSANQTLVWSSYAFRAAPKEHLLQLIRWLGLDEGAISEQRILRPIHTRAYPAQNLLSPSLMLNLVKATEPHKANTLHLLQQHGYQAAAEQLAHAWEIELEAVWAKFVHRTFNTT